jgi:hypothetical protein
MEKTTSPGAHRAARDLFRAWLRRAFSWLPSRGKRLAQRGKYQPKPVQMALPLR